MEQQFATWSSWCGHWMEFKIGLDLDEHWMSIGWTIEVIGTANLKIISCLKVHSFTGPPFPLDLFSLMIFSKTLLPKGIPGSVNEGTPVYFEFDPVIRVYRSVMQQMTDCVEFSPSTVLFFWHHVSCECDLFLLYCILVSGYLVGGQNLDFQFYICIQCKRGGSKNKHRIQKSLLGHKMTIETLQEVFWRFPFFCP